MDAKKMWQAPEIVSLSINANTEALSYYAPVPDGYWSYAS